MSTAARPRLLDLFCGAGGAAMGYSRAGFDVVGVDLAPQPRYPFEFHQADALDVLDALAGGDADWLLPKSGCFDAVHASPVCKRYSVVTPLRVRDQHPDQIGPVRDLLTTAGMPWVIENVPGAPLRPDLKLCGCMFGLPNLKRERWFETSWHAFGLRQPCDHREPVITVSGTGAGNQHSRAGHHGFADWRRAMGIDWMTGKELSQAIPPAYTEHIGLQLLEHLSELAA
jgi:DNA (cytosine-5)-methyltransferase 1